MAFRFKFAPRVARLCLIGSAVLMISIACSQGGELKEGFAPALDTTVTRLVILPSTAQIAVQESLQLSLHGLNDSGDTLNVNVDWEATGGTILPSGLFYASTDGTYRVTARGRGLGWGPGGPHRADTSVVVVSDTAQGPVLSAVILTPNAVTLSPGGTQEFSAAGRLSDGNATSVQVDYSVTGGSMTGNGHYTAGATAGTFSVIATERGGSLADTAAVTITLSPPPPPTLTGVTLTPASVTLQAGATQQFTATGQWSDGTSSTVTVTFAATGGTITALGMYAAGSTAGSFQVIATETSALADTAQVTVTATPPPPPTLQDVVLTPESVTLAAGATQQFSTSGLMSDGSSATISVTYAATGGAINGTGLYTAGSSSGNFRVIATESGGLADTSQVTVTAPPPPPPPPSGTDLFLDFNDGTSLNSLGVNIGGSTTGSLPEKKHSWVPTGGFDGGGFIRMTWFTGMPIGFSPVQIQVPGGYTPHFELKYMVRQSDTMIHAGSAVKLLRLINHESRRTMGTLEWTGTDPNKPQRFRWFFDFFAIAPPTQPNKSSAPFCVWDLTADPAAGCSPKIDDLIGNGWHEWKIECNYNDPEASFIILSIDGVTTNTVNLNPESAADKGPSFIQPIGTRFDVSPFAEMYSCGQSGCQSTINSGTFDVDHFSYTVLP